jgi:hypothetical protein
MQDLQIFNQLASNDPNFFYYDTETMGRVMCTFYSMCSLERNSTDAMSITKVTWWLLMVIIFSSFRNQIEWFLCDWTHKLKGYKCSWSITSKGAMPKTQEEWWVIVFFNCVGKIFRLLSRSSPISSLVCFEWVKHSWVCQLRLYKTSFYCRGQDITI